MITNKQAAGTVLLMIIFSGTVPGANSSADEEQKLYHVWTPEPNLATAIVCLDNQYGGMGPADPNRQKPVPLPAAVRAVICDLTRWTFTEMLYEGPTEYASLFGPVHRLAIPDNPALHLYVYELKAQPTLRYRYYSMILILHNSQTNAVSPVGAEAGTDYQEYCPKPWIRFQQVVGDQALEILLLTGHHRGTGADYTLLHVLRVEEDLSLREVLTLRTAISMQNVFPGETWEERSGFAVRITRPVEPGSVLVTVSLSKSKLEAGERILGFETWEMGEDGRMHRTAHDQIVDEDYNYVFRPGETLQRD